MTTWQLLLRKLKIGKKVDYLPIDNFMCYREVYLISVTISLEWRSSHFYYKVGFIDWLTAWRIISKKTFFSNSISNTEKLGPLGTLLLEITCIHLGRLQKLLAQEVSLHLCESVCLSPYDISSHWLIISYINDHCYSISWHYSISFFCQMTMSVILLLS